MCLTTLVWAGQTHSLLSGCFAGRTVVSHFATLPPQWSPDAPPYLETCIFESETIVQAGLLKAIVQIGFFVMLAQSGFFYFDA